MKQQITEEEPKRVMKKFTDYMLKILLIIGGLFTGYYAFKLFIIFIATPVLTVYNAATNLYSITNDPSLFIAVSNFSKGYVNSWIFMILGLFVVLFVRAIRKKLEEKYARD